MILNIPLHLFPGRDEVIIPSIHFVFPSTPRCVWKISFEFFVLTLLRYLSINPFFRMEDETVSLTWNAAAEFVGELGDEVVVDAILERTEDNNWPSVLYGELLDCLVRQHVFFAACNCQCKYILVTGTPIRVRGKNKPCYPRLECSHSFKQTFLFTYLSRSSRRVSHLRYRRTRENGQNKRENSGQKIMGESIAISGIVRVTWAMIHALASRRSKRGEKR